MIAPSSQPTKPKNDPRKARPDAKFSRHNLVFGGPLRVATMVQPLASAARLRGAGPFSVTACKPGEISGCCHLGSLGTLLPEGSERRTCACFRFSELASHSTGRRTTPPGMSPVSTNRHSAMSSLRANATIIVVRLLPAPMLAWNH